MIRVGGTYRFGNEMHEPFVFVVVDVTSDFRNSERDHTPKEGFVCLMLRGRFERSRVFANGDDGMVLPGETFAVAERSTISTQSVAYDGSDP